MSSFGPGTFQIGEVGSEIDASCLVNSLTITPSKETGDSTTKLCGTVKPGAVTYTYTLGGNVDTDSEDAEGFFATCEENAGQEVPFTFTPNTADETTATGTVVLDPLPFGGEEYGADMTSDFEFDIVGRPEYTYPEAPTPPAASARFNRRVVHGTPPTGVRPAADGTYPKEQKPAEPEPEPASTSSSRSSSTSSSSSEPASV